MQQRQVSGLGRSPSGLDIAFHAVKPPSKKERGRTLLA